MLHLLFVLASLFSVSAWGSDQVMRYSLDLDGVSVGERQVEIRYLPPPEGEIDQARMIRSTMSLNISLDRLSYRMVSRVSAMHGPSGTNFVTSVQENEAIREIQARAERGGEWSVSGLENGERTEWTFRRGEVGVTSMEMLDPERYRRLLDGPTAPMLVAETGQVIVGQVQDMGEAQMQIAGQLVNVHRIAWTSEAGAMELNFSENGLLLDYSLDFLGKRLHARLEQLPNERSWGGFKSSVVDEVVEEEL